MANYLKPDDAIKKAESEFAKWLATVQDQVDAYEAGGEWTLPIKNDGTDDYVWEDRQDAIIAKWVAKPLFHGFNRRAGPTSNNEGKLDLKFAYPGQSKSSFNYHIVTKPDPALEEAQREKAAAALAAKRLAADNAARLAKEAKDKAAAAKKAEDQKKLDDARLKKITDGANTAWNTFKGTKAWNNKIVEKTWKAQWIKDNQAKYK